MLTVLMPTYNGAGTLPEVLQAYTALQAPPGGWRLIVADNGSSDGTAAVLQRFHGRLPLTTLYVARRGRSAALNDAVALGLLQMGDGSDLFMFGDDDAIPACDWLRRMVHCARLHPGRALFGGAIVPAWRVPPAPWLLRLTPEGLTWGVTSPALRDGPVYPGLVWGANMAIRRRMFETGARYDESIGPKGASYAMGSETRLNLDMFQSGHLPWFCPQARVSHIIRTHQVDMAWIVHRAYLFGRGKCRLHMPEQTVELLGVPRWMLGLYVRHLAGSVSDWLRRDREALFQRRWEMASLRGFFHEAWRGRRKRLPRIVISSYSGELGGMELRMAQEARVLDAAGYHSMLALRRFPGFQAWAQGLKAEQLRVSIYEPPLFIEHWAWRRVNLLRAKLLGAWRLRRYRPDLVHVAFCWTTYGASILWQARQCRLPTVISVHNAFPLETLSAWQQPLMREAFRGVKGVYAVSLSSMQHFLALYRDWLAPGTRLAVIPNGVDTDRFIVSLARREQARRQLRLPQDALVLGSVARLSAQKRPQELLALFIRLQPRFPNLYLVLAGTGPLEAMLRLQVQAAGLGGCVLFTGFQQRIDLLMPAFDLHLLLSKNEGFGISTIEAMACGVPAVGTDVPGSSDILRGSRGGLLLPLDDAEMACEAVAALLQDRPRRSEMGRQARIEAEQRYSMRRLEQQLRGFYAGLV
ncbi:MULTISPECIES: glycosyltransferase [unclassified Janthinobacterium]|uniref:glycosyltransferase n=1 Tax=unclassified Janthinobacterium TaxID=2610881 RepID=UPI0018559B24|nr:MULTISPECIES: glycosyltransferase [unclassified Janthinobacterium]MBB5369832.1 glycosyltransferase involved in cell wall biosynthesis [Janthinobacterium sp. K2C7]MBB5382638.1 glycosyltransferase involved in cell wall biosynthesis [Janthinobacterium sp. K2Li3]MBB5384623.1 glycosyltransferase involved in cell wall biosynthesis [Janthinobacterium sp. K2E3]